MADSTTPREADDSEQRTKRRKRKRPGKAAEEQQKQLQQPDKEPAVEEAGDEETEEGAAEEAGGRRRYIVFVGNLPYRVSVRDVEQLFSAMHPVGCRLPTDKDNRKPKGYAFVEFDDASCMRRALQLHHSVLGGRSINVELTAGGGGGKSALRKERIKTKNAALAKERKALRDKQGKDKQQAEQSAADSGRRSTEHSVSGSGPNAGTENENEEDGSRRKSKRRRRKGKGGDRADGEQQGEIDA